VPGARLNTALAPAGHRAGHRSSSLGAVKLSNRLFDLGVNGQPIIAPAGEERHARLRFFLSCEHTNEQLALTAEILANENDLM
jgi:7-keto-8-aminopelargonate synthetase-like enzyme